MKSADRSGARFALIIGEDELAADEVTLRPMLGHKADGEQRRVARADLLSELSRYSSQTVTNQINPHPADSASADPTNSGTLT
jgi:histidyl-tRNA synthetase